MKLSKFLLLFQFIAIVESIGQLPIKPWQPIIFKEIQPNWQTTLFDEEALSDSTDGYNKLGAWFNDHIIFNNSIFTYSYINSSKDLEGGFIQRTDINTGAVIWKARFDYKSDGEQKAIQTIFLNEDNNIEILGQKSLDSFSLNRLIPFIVKDDNTVLFRKIYDFDTGNLLFDFEADKNENALIMPFSFGIGSGHTYIFNNNDHIAVIRNPLINGKQALQLIKIDSLGIAHEFSDTILFEGLVRNIIQLDNSYLVVSSLNQRVIFQYLNFNFTTLKNTLLPAEVSVENLAIRSVNKLDKTITLSTQSFNENSIDSFTTYTFYLSTFEGHLINSWKFYTYKSFLLSIYTFGNELFLFNNENRGDIDLFTSSIIIRKANETHSFDEIYNLELTDKEKVPYVRNVTANYEGDLIMLIDESSITKTSNTTYSIDRNANALTIISLFKESISLIPTLVQLNDYQPLDQLNLYPNPSNGTFLLETTLKINYIEIVTSSGTLIKNQTPTTESITIDLEDCPNGIYHVKFITDDNRIITRKVLKSN